MQPDYRIGYGLGVLDRESLNLELGSMRTVVRIRCWTAPTTGSAAGRRWAGSRVFGDAPQDGRSAKQKVHAELRVPGGRAPRR